MWSAPSSLALRMKSGSLNSGLRTRAIVTLTPAALLAILRQLYAVDVAGWLVQTPAEDFGHGEGLSEMAQRGVEAAPAVAARLIAAVGTRHGV